MEIDEKPTTIVPLIPTKPGDKETKDENDTSHILERKLSLEQVDPNEYSATRGDDNGTVDRSECSKETCSSTRVLNFLRKRYGIILIFSTALCFSILSILVKLLLDTIQPFQAVLMVMPVMMFGAIFLGVCQRIPHPNNYQSYIWLFFSGIFLTLNTAFFVTSITYIDVADATTILYTSLIFVGIFSWIILREPLRPFDFLFALLAFAGVIFVARPPFIFGSNGGNETSSSHSFAGIAYALGAAFAITLLYVFIRKQSTLGIHSLFSMFLNSTIVVVACAVIAIIIDDWTKPTAQDWMYALLAGFINLLGQCALYFALKVESATIVTIMLTLEIVFSFMFQFLFLQVSATWTSYVGALLVISACIGITVKNRPPSTTSDSHAYVEQ